MSRTQKTALIGLLYYAVFIICTGTIALTINGVITPEVFTASVAPGQIVITGLDHSSPAKNSESFETRDYLQCVPACAVIADDSSTYVYVVDKRSGFFGQETYARRVNVSITAIDHEVAAINEGILADGQKVIVSSSRAITDNEVVRVIEEP